MDRHLYISQTPSFRYLGDEDHLGVIWNSQGRLPPGYPDDIIGDGHLFTDPLRNAGLSSAEGHALFELLRLNQDLKPHALTSIDELPKRYLIM